MSKSSAFTLIESVVALAVVSILFGVAVPTFGDLIKRNRIGGMAHQLHAVLYLARIESIKRSTTLTLCKSADQATCSGTWRDGWILFTDSNADRTVDGSDEILKTATALPEGYTLSWNAFGSTTYLNFQATGLTNQNGTFTFCPPDHDAEFAKALVVSKTGRVRVNRNSLSCP